MSDDTTANNQKKMAQQGDTESLELQKAIETIKNPPAIDDVIRELPPEEKKGNQAVAPEEFYEAGDLRDDLKR